MPVHLSVSVNVRQLSRYCCYPCFSWHSLFLVFLFSLFLGVFGVVSVVLSFQIACGVVASHFLLASHFALKGGEVLIVFFSRLMPRGWTRAPRRIEESSTGGSGQHTAMCPNAEGSECRLEKIDAEREAEAAQFEAPYQWRVSGR